jgi:protoporphyrinogen oxidase
MASTIRNVVVVGGGLSGLFSALLISDSYPRLQVHIVEKDAVLGGGHGSFFDPVGGCFDHGMHLMFDSLIPEVDRHIREIMNEEDWIILSGNQKDIAGIYYGGRLHEDSPYIDLRLLPEKFRRDCISDLVLAIANRPPGVAECTSADDFFRRRFGPSIAENVIDPLLRKLWRKSGGDLDAMATRIVLMDRVLLYDTSPMIDLMKSGLIRSRIGFPKQMELSLEYRNAQRGYYPRKYGMYRVIEAIKRKLLGRGVAIHLQAESRELEITDNAIRRVRIAGPEGEVDIDDIAMLHWTIPLFSLAPKIGLALPSARFDPPLPQLHAYFLLKHPPRMGNLYSFYCFDPGYATYRVTSYASYCPDARRPDGTWPVCAELHFDPGTKLSEIDAQRLATEELKSMGIISGLDEIAFSRAVPAKIGFPLLTHNNTANLTRLRDSIDGRGIRNLLTAGFSPERGIFFVHDVLEQNYLGIINQLGDS